MPELRSPGERLRVGRHDDDSIAVFDRRELEGRRQFADVCAAIGVVAFLVLFVAPLFSPISFLPSGFTQLAYAMILAVILLFFARFLRQTYVFDGRSLQRRIGITATLSIPIPTALGSDEAIASIEARSEHGRDAEDGMYALVVEGVDGSVSRPLEGLAREEAEWLEEMLRASLPETCFNTAR